MTSKQEKKRIAPISIPKEEASAPASVFATAGIAELCASNDAKDAGLYNVSVLYRDSGNITKLVDLLCVKHETTRLVIAKYIVFSIMMLFMEEEFQRDVETIERMLAELGCKAYAPNDDDSDDDDEKGEQPSKLPGRFKAMINSVIDFDFAIAVAKVAPFVLAKRPEITPAYSLRVLRAFQTFEKFMKVHNPKLVNDCLVGIDTHPEEFEARTVFVASRSWEDPQVFPFLKNHSAVRQCAFVGEIGVKLTALRASIKRLNFLERTVSGLFEALQGTALKYMTPSARVWLGSFFVRLRAAFVVVDDEKDEAKLVRSPACVKHVLANGTPFCTLNCAAGCVGGYLCPIGLKHHGADEECKCVNICLDSACDAVNCKVPKCETDGISHAATCSHVACRIKPSAEELAMEGVDEIADEEQKSDDEEVLGDDEDPEATESDEDVKPVAKAAPVAQAAAASSSSPSVVPMVDEGVIDLTGDSDEDRMVD